MKKIFKQKNKGFTLVETLVAISIFTMSILGLMSVLASGIADTNYAKQKIVASYLAQEGIEYVRNMRDNLVLFDAVSPQNGWTAFRSANKNYPISGSDFSGFSRTMSTTAVAGTTDEIKISSTVSWNQGSGVRSVTFSENLYNWIE
jgi:Tfp pilus assembly protein PilV